jgi:hypothetical protein
MGTPWHSTGPLTLDCDGVLWQRYRAGWVYHGPVERLEVPDWLLADAAALLDLWADRYDSRAEEEAAWALAKAL